MEQLTEKLTEKLTERITVEKVMEAYIETGTIPANGWGGCAAGAIAKAAGVEHPDSRSFYIGNRFGSNYRRAFTTAFDGGAPFTFLDERERQGYEDGKAARAAILPWIEAREKITREGLAELEEMEQMEEAYTYH
jgi:hypothetical protein